LPGNPIIKCPTAEVAGNRGQSQSGSFDFPVLNALFDIGDDNEATDSQKQQNQYEFQKGEAVAIVPNW